MSNLPGKPGNSAGPKGPRMTHYRAHALLRYFSYDTPRTIKSLVEAHELNANHTKRAGAWLAKHGYIVSHARGQGYVRTPENTQSLAKKAEWEWADAQLARMGERICTACGMRQPRDQFTADAKRTQTGRICRTCRAATYRKRYATDPDFKRKVFERDAKRWVNPTPEQIETRRRQAREWQARNRQRQRADAFAARLATVRIVRRDRQEVA